MPLKQKSTILAADGSLIATLAEQNRVPVKLSQVAPIMQKAMVAIEDDRFYEHGALDLKGTLRVLLRNQSEGTVQQGGSSITQQQKMSLVEKANTPDEVAAATAETYQRKVERELRYAIAVEKEYSKNEILEEVLRTWPTSVTAPGVSRPPPALLPGARVPADPAAGGAAGRPGEEPDRLRPDERHEARQGPP